MSRKKHKKGHSEGHEGGSERWLISYGDMLTLLFALFVIMYGLSKANDAGSFRQLQEELERKFKLEQAEQLGYSWIKEVNVEDLVIVDATAPKTEYTASDDLLIMAQKMYKALKKQKVTTVVQMHVTERGLVVSLITDQLLFEVGQAELRPHSRFLLDTLGDILCKDDHELRIEGHTCNLQLPPGARFKNNWELSTIRATNVAEYLIKVKHVDPERISVIGYGEYRPLYPNDSESNRLKNRRVDIVILRRTQDKSIPEGQKYQVTPPKEQEEFSPGPPKPPGEEEGMPAEPPSESPGGHGEE